MYFLLITPVYGRETDFYDFAMEQTVRIGGDTDTNADIVGGVVGAYVQI